MGWDTQVTIIQIRHTTFSIEVEFATSDSGGKLWAIFLHASNRENVRTAQWAELLDRKATWGDRWIFGGDLNDICRVGEKKGGRDRTESSYKGFKEFIERMEMVEVAFQGRQYIWANNWEDKGYIEARLDRFFGVA